MKNIFVEKLFGILAGPMREITEVFLVKDSTGVKEAKNGKHWIGLTLRDRTGDVGCKIWDAEENGVYPQPGDFIKVRGEVGEYEGKTQITIALAKKGRFRVLEPGEYDLTDFIPASKRDRDEMYRDILRWIEHIQNLSVRETVCRMISFEADRVKNAPAASHLHQAYLGGLAEHMLNLAALADHVGSLYPDLNKDLLIAAALIHDIGKCFELNFETQIAYSRRGRLVGHVAIGLQMFAKHRVDDSAELDHLEHIISSHHGYRKWGAPTEPMTREAIVFHELDMIDSKYWGATATLNKEPLDTDGFTLKTVRGFGEDYGYAWLPGGRPEAAPEPEQPSLLTTY